jgi:hypothetical protein
MKYLLSLSMIILSACSLTVAPGTIEALKHHKLIGSWSNKSRSYVKIFCKGQFSYFRDYELHESLATKNNKDSGGRIGKIKGNKISIIPLGMSYLIDKMPYEVKGTMTMEFEGETYYLVERFTCDD